MKFRLLQTCPTKAIVAFVAAKVSANDSNEDDTESDSMNDSGPRVDSYS